MKTPLIACITLAASLLAGGGCARVEKENRRQVLDAALDAYRSSLRWAYYETAYGHLHPDSRTGIAQGLDNVRVISYEVVRPPLMTDETQTRAEQVVRIGYVLRDEQVVRSLSDRQDWRYDPQTERWWLFSDMPAFD
jgi:hypothetical protein